MKNNSILSLLVILISLGCSSISSGNQFELAIRGDDFLVYFKNPNNQTEDRIKRISQEKLSDFFRNIFYYKSNPINSEKMYIFDKLKSDKIASIILDLKDSADSLVLISKREDPMAPYSRIYRTSLRISFPLNSIKIDFLEIDKYYIFGNQYSLADWSFISEVAECNYKNNLYFENSINYVLSIESRLCTDNLFHDFIIYPEDFAKPSNIKNISKVIQDRLLIIEELKKNKVISELEYQKLRENILKNL